MYGILNFDKPPSLSSARAVERVKRLLPRGTKIGHAGALDPFATGVLLLLIGQATRQCERIMDAPKRYEATIKLGAYTATGDPESPEIAVATDAPVTLGQIEAALAAFTGEILQRPPAYSALKIAGRRASDLARQGKAPEMPARPVNVYSISLLRYEWPHLSLRIDCGRGTYVRSIARDLGAALNTAGYLTSLRRTRIGPFDVANAATLPVLQAEGVERHLIDPAIEISSSF